MMIPDCYDYSKRCQSLWAQYSNNVDSFWTIWMVRRGLSQSQSTRATSVCWPTIISFLLDSSEDLNLMPCITFHGHFSSLCPPNTKPNPDFTISYHSKAYSVEEIDEHIQAMKYKAYVRMNYRLFHWLGRLFRPWNNHQEGHEISSGLDERGKCGQVALDPSCHHQGIWESPRWNNLAMK